MKNEKKVTIPVVTTSVTPVTKNVTTARPAPIVSNRPTVTSATTIRTTSTNVKSILFGKENYKWMLIGLVLMALGFFLMVGGKSPDPKVFTDSEVYSTTRITIAPILIIAGLLTEIYAIMRKSKTV